MINTFEDAKKFYNELTDFMYSHVFDSIRYTNYLHRDKNDNVIVDIIYRGKVIATHNISPRYIWNERELINQELLRRRNPLCKLSKGRV